MPKTTRTEALEQKIEKRLAELRSLNTTRRGKATWRNARRRTIQVEIRALGCELRDAYEENTDA